MGVKFLGIEPLFDLNQYKPWTADDTVQTYATLSFPVAPFKGVTRLGGP